jgi:hypothetical protein
MFIDDINSNTSCNYRMMALAGDKNIVTFTSSLPRQSIGPLLVA